MYKGDKPDTFTKHLLALFPKLKGLRRSIFMQCIFNGHETLFGKTCHIFQWTYPELHAIPEQGDWVLGVVVHLLVYLLLH